MNMIRLTLFHNNYILTAYMVASNPLTTIEVYFKYIPRNNAQKCKLQMLTAMSSFSRLTQVDFHPCDEPME